MMQFNKVETTRYIITFRFLNRDWYIESDNKDFSEEDAINYVVDRVACVKYFRDENALDVYENSKHYNGYIRRIASVPNIMPCDMERLKLGVDPTLINDVKLSKEQLLRLNQFHTQQV